MNPIARLRSKFLKDFKKLLAGNTLDVEDDKTFTSLVQVATIFLTQQAIADKSEFGKGTINRWRRGVALTRNMRSRRLLLQDITELMKSVRK